MSESIFRFDDPSRCEYDEAVISVNEDGDTLAELKELSEGDTWTAVYNDPRPETGPEYHGCTLDNDGNVVAVGVIALFQTAYSVFTGEFIVVKYDQSGQLLPGWPVIYKEEGFRWNEAHNVVVDADDNIWVSGYTGTVGNDFYFAVWKLGPDGSLAEGWPRFPFGPNAYGNNIIVDSRGNILACAGGSYGKTVEGVTDYMVVMKYGPDGTPAEGWPKTYQVPESRHNFAYGLAEDMDGNFLVAGFTQTGGNRDAALLKIDSEGNVIEGWPKTWDSGSGWYDEYYTVSQDRNGDYCLVGICQDATGENGRLLVTRFSEEGEQLTSEGWPRIYERDGLRDWSPPDSWGGSVDSSGNIVAAATCQSDTHVDTVKYTPEASMFAGFPKIFDGEGRFDVTRSCCVDDLDNIYTVGFSEFDDGTEQDYYTFIVKYPPAAYCTARPAIVLDTGLDATGLAGFGETLGSENEGSMAYQLSPDGEEWYYHGGSSWTGASDKFQANTADEVSRSIGSFAEQAGGGMLHLKAFLVSDGTQKVQLEAVTVSHK
ncbi:MAG: hypothetical protein SWK76_02550 [Actinomycetota bacterium]|nr:hypothetical protein [Actinomycetota bacterium]